MKFWVATAFMRTNQLPHVAKLLDDAGYHGVLISDHLCYPKELASPYPYSPHPDGRPIWEPETSWPEPFVLMGAMAAVTERIVFSNNIYIAGHRPILQVAKEVATVAALSDGRVALGVGAGWMREEFELQGQDFTNRGPRLTEMIQALRELWKGGWVEWHGTYYDIPSLTLEPAPPGPVPIYVGGHTDAALRRAAKVADGWIGNAYPWDDAEKYIAKLKGYLHEYGRDGDPFEIIIGLYDVPSVDLYERAEAELGVTGMMCVPWAMGNTMEGDLRGLDQVAGVYRDSINRFADEIVHPLGIGLR